jgi:deoxyribonuclease-4
MGLDSAALNGLRFGTVGSPLKTPKPGGTVKGIAYSKELGLDALELAWVQSVRIGDGACAAIKAAAEAHGLALSVHAPYYINLNAQEAAILEASRERVLKAARAGYQCGATDIIFHPGSYHAQPPATVYARIRDELKELTRILRAEGVHVRLRPETTGKAAMFGGLDEVLALSREVEGVAPCIDFAHLHARSGDGRVNTYEEFADVLRRVAAELGARGLHDMHIHLSGIEYGPRGEKQHLSFDEADLRYRELLQALVDFGVRGRVLCESPKMEDDALLLRQTYEELMRVPA